MHIRANKLGAILLAGALWGTAGMVALSTDMAQAAPANKPAVLAAKSNAQMRQDLEDDIAVSQIVYAQELGLSEAAQAMEDSLYGRCAFSVARQKVQQSLAKGDKLNRDLQNYHKHHPSALGKAGLHLWTLRRQILTKMDNLLAQGQIERSTLSAFQEQNGALTKAVVVQWLGAKLNRAQIGQCDSNKAAAGYYTWQLRAVPAQKQMCISSQRLLELASMAANQQNYSIRELQAIRADIRAQANKMGIMRTVGKVQRAQNDMLKEMDALARLAEAIELMAHDRSVDASDRVARCHKNLARASINSSRSALQALQACK